MKLMKLSRILKTVDTKEKIITFINDEKNDLLSRNHLKDINKYIKRID